MSANALPDPAYTGAGLSEPARFIDAYVAPSKTFEDLRRNASWWFPFVVSLVVSILFTFSLEKKVGWDTVVRHQIAQSKMAQDQMDKLPPDQQEMAVQKRVGFTRVISYAYAPLGLIFAAIVAGIFMLSCNFGLGAREPYKRYFAIWMYGAVPMILKALLIVILMWAGAVSAETFDIQNPIGSNIGFYLGASSPAWLKTLLTSADVFTIWTVILLSLAISIACRVSRGAAAAVVGGWWAVTILFGVAMAAMFS